MDLSPDLLSRISSVDSRVRVIEAKQPDPPDEALKALPEAQVFFGFRFPRDWYGQAANLKWVQLSSAGADGYAAQGLPQERPDVRVTTASGIHEVPISEHILGMMLHFSRRFNVAVRNQPQHNWERLAPDELYRKTVCLVGYGPIARRAAMLCAAFGMRVLCVRASLSALAPGLAPVDRFYPVSALNEALAQADFVVVAAPRTPQSERMIGEAQFEVMKQGVVLICISRGALVDEPALVKALRSGKLGGAGLDVFTVEPLPRDSPLWDMENVLITPHNSGANPYYNERATDLFCDNLGRFLRGEPLRNLVDFGRGY
jgi:phosphoglycerate dehydrogenase-like enzyme